MVTRTAAQLSAPQPDGEAYGKGFNGEDIWAGIWFPPAQITSLWIAEIALTTASPGVLSRQSRENPKFGLDLLRKSALSKGQTHFGRVSWGNVAGYSRRFSRGITFEDFTGNCSLESTLQICGSILRIAIFSPFSGRFPGMIPQGCIPLPSLNSPVWD